MTSQVLHGHDIRRRVLLVTLLPVAILAVVLTTFFASARFDDLEQALRQRGRAVAVQLAAAADYGVFSGNREVLQGMANAALAQADVVSVTILGINGDLLTQSGAPMFRAVPGARMERQMESVRGGRMIFQVPVAGVALAMNDVLSENSLETPRGQVIVEVSREGIEAQKQSLLLSSSLISLLLLGGSAVLAIGLSRRFTRPLESIAETVNRISDGDFSARVSVEVSGSLKLLGEQINQMTLMLGSSHEELQRRILEATEELVLRKEEAEKANMAKSRFLAAASHDLRQPMHALGLFVAQMLPLVESTEAAMLAGRISDSVRALEVLLDGLLDISKLDAGVMNAKNADFPVASVLARIEADHAGSAAQKGIYLRVRPCERWVRTDPVLLERILQNLVGNAVRYTRNGGVMVACRKRGDWLRIEVRDSGMGIPQEFQKSIFQEFVQLHNPGRNRGQGLGLGLAIVKRLVDLLELGLGLESAPGRGSVFAVDVPLIEARTQAVESRPVSVLPEFHEGGDIILVIDDDMLVLSSVVGLLESWGHVVVAANSGAEASEIISESGIKPNLVLCDYRLEDNENGIEVIESLRRQCGVSFPAVLISGDTAPEVLKEARELGLTLLHKPVAPAKLRTLLLRMSARERHITS